LHWFQRQVKLSSGEDACCEVLEVALEGAGVLDLESPLLLLDADDAWAASETWAAMAACGGI